MKRNLPDTPVIHISWPEPSSLALAETCQKLALGKDWNELCTSMDVLHALQKAPAPIVGVMGLLNAGKSSLVKHFLSPTGKDRVLTGIGAAQGTQRFIFWLPQSWKNEPGIWAAFKEELEAAFGNQLEELSEDPTRAAGQYNGGGDIAGTFGTPLIAFDPGLDPYGFCLLDCPDFERIHPGAQGADTASIRVEFVRRAAHLLSAVIVLGERDKAAAGTLLLPFTHSGQMTNGKPTRTARELQLDGKPVFLLLNKLNFHAESAEFVMKDREVQELMSSLGVERVFIAYHGGLDKADEVIPHVFRGSSYDPRLPYFFELSSVDGGNAPAAVDESRMLGHHLGSLRPAELWEAKRKAKAAQVVAEMGILRNNIGRRLEEHRQFLFEKQDGVVSFVRDRLRSKNNELAFPLFPETVALISEAILDSAPWYAKPVMWVHQGSKKLMDFVSEARDVISAKQKLLDPGSIVRESAQNLKKKAGNAETATFDPVEWARQSRNQKFMPDGIPEERLVALWTKVREYSLDTAVHLDEKELKQFAEGLWDALPWSKKVGLAVTGPFLMIAALASVIFAMFDGGSTTIFLFFSLKEIFIAVGLGGAAAAANLKFGGRLESHLVKRAGIPFYERLLKGALDAFGLPRKCRNPLREHFSNTGRFELNLDRPPGEASLPIMENLSEDHILGDIHEPGWDAFREQIVALTSTSQKK